MKIDLSNSVKKSTATAFAQLMGSDTADSSRIRQIPIDELIPYDDQPFKPYSPEKLQELAEDIKTNGILSPVTVREHGNSYQILSGHNRTNAARLAELDTVPCIIKDVDDDTAIKILVNANLCQRDKLSHSEKAIAYALLYNNKKQTLTDFAESQNENKRQIYRYIRLASLIPELLEMVDDGNIPFIGGYNLSFLSVDDQQLLYSYTGYNGIYKLSLNQTESLKSLGSLTEESLDAFFAAKHPKAEYKFKVNKSQLSTLLMCLRAQAYAIEPGAYKKLLAMLEACDI